MLGNGLTRFATAFTLVAVLSLSALSGYLRSFNEVSPDERQRGPIKTRIGDYVSFDPIGTFPISLITALKKWPTSRDCIENETSRRLRWQAFQSSSELKVCLTRLIAGMNRPENMNALFQANGFKSSASPQPPSGTEKSEHEFSCERGTICQQWAEQQGYFFLKPYSVSARVTLSGNRLMNVSITELLK